MIISRFLVFILQKLFSDASFWLCICRYLLITVYAQSKTLHQKSCCPSQDFECRVDHIISTRMSPPDLTNKVLPLDPDTCDEKDQYYGRIQSDQLTAKVLAVWIYSHFQKSQDEERS